MENVQENKILSFGLAHNIMLDLKNNEITDNNAIWDIEGYVWMYVQFIIRLRKFQP